MMIAKISGKAYTVEAELSMMGDATKSIKDKMILAIVNKNDHKETIGQRLNIDFKVSGRYFIPVLIDLSDGFVNGAIGTLKHIDVDPQGEPVTL